MMCPDRWAGVLYRLTQSACMLDPMDYGRSRARAQLVVRRAARDEFGRRLGAESAASVLARADREYPAIAVRIPPTGLGARNLLRTGAYAVALQRALVDAGIDPTVANTLVSDVVFAAILPAREALAKVGPDPPPRPAASQHVAIGSHAPLLLHGTGLGDDRCAGGGRVRYGHHPLCRR